MPKVSVGNSSPKSQAPQERRSKSISPRKSKINRAKSREITQRPLPCSLSNSESDDDIETDPTLFSNNQEINLQEVLQESDNSPVKPKVKKRPKKKNKAPKIKLEINEVLVDMRQKMYNAIKLNDVSLLKSIFTEIDCSISAEKVESNTGNNNFSWTTDELVKVS